MLIRNTGLPWGLLGLLLTGCGPARAHDLWIEPDSVGCTLHRGHRSSDHQGIAELLIPPENIAAVLCWPPAGAPVALALPLVDHPHIPCNGPMVHVELGGGYWTKTVYGTQPGPRSQATHVLRSWQSFESVTYLRAWPADWDARVGAHLAVLPMHDPFTLGRGTKLRVRVTLAGEPVADATVTYQGKPRGKTGPAGTLNVRLRESGLQMIQAGLTCPTDDPEVDEVVYSATLNFHVEE